MDPRLRGDDERDLENAKEVYRTIKQFSPAAFSLAQSC